MNAPHQVASTVERLKINKEVNESSHANWHHSRNQKFSITQPSVAGQTQIADKKPVVTEALKANPRHLRMSDNLVMLNPLPSITIKSQAYKNTT